MSRCLTRGRRRWWLRSRAMTWRRTANAWLSERTGYRIVRAASARPRPAKARRGLPKRYDEEAKETIRAVRPRTMTAHEKLFALIEAVRHVARHGVEGAVVECGVWRGGSQQEGAPTPLAPGAAHRDPHPHVTPGGQP